ncbi:hypothetical protein B0J12DRAFT_93151 [Macrophomina phaseolina]|uniref:F-box domain-containing protein n=1 Tax=Macrophomina phaseolina TaxID=35725 RepID=A0ABQ8GB05_9PEZI|nr:hypothetical protein B0J12DRAFT_93151 [Macrophomina phaseolina]
MASRTERGLAGLSEELVERLFSFLEPRDLMATALVSRAFSRIAGPLLYRTMVIGGTDGRGQKSIRALLDHPQHASSSVREAVVYTSAAQLGALPLASTFTARQQQTLGEWTPLHREHLSRYVDIVGRVVQQMASLQTLEVRFLRHSDLQELLRCVFRDYGRVSDPAKMFPKLATVRFRPVDIDEEDFVRLRLSTLAPVFRLPRLKHLEMQNVEIVSDSLDDAELSPTPTVKTLTLRECPLRPHHVVALLQACPALESFDCEIMYDAEYAASTGPYDFSDISDAIGTLSETLQYLRLIIILFTTTAIDIGNPGPWGISSSIGRSLKTFKQLKRLQVSLPVLLGWHARGTASLADVLPDSLEELFVTQEPAYWDGYEWNDLDFSEEPGYVAVCTKIRDYIQDKPERLRKITIAVEDMEDQEAMVFTQDIADLAAKIGIEVEILPERYA